MLSAVDDPVFVLDADGRIVFTSESALWLTRKEPARLLGARWSDLFDAASGQRLQDVFHDRKPFQALSFLHNSSHHPFICSFKPVSDHALVTLRAAADPEVLVLLDSFLESSSVGFGILDDQLRYVKVNQTLAEMNKIPLQDHIGRTVEEIVPRFAPQVVPHLREVFQTGRPKRAVLLQEVVPGGSQSKGRWVLECFPVRTADGRVLGVGATIVDISREFEAQEKLKELRRLFDAVIQQLPFAVAVAQPETGKLIYGNDAIASIWRQPFAFVDIGKYSVQWKGNFPDGSPVGNEDWPMSRALHGKTVKNELIHILRPDGTIGITEQWATPIFGDDGKLVAGVVAFTDVTERIETERQRDKLLRELETILASISDPLIVFDEKGEPTRMNAAALEFCGMSSQNEQGVTRQAILDRIELKYPDGREVPASELPSARTLRGEHLVRECLLIKDSSGRSRFVMVNTSPFLGENGRISGAVSVWHDVTELKDVEARLHEAIQLRDEFMAIASHELKTPLTSLCLQLQVLKRKRAEIVLEAERLPEPSRLKSLLTQDLVQLVDPAEAQSRRLSELLVDMLELARVRRPSIRIRKESSELTRVVREVLDRFEADLALRKIPVEVIAPAPVSGFWDALRIEQVVTNLLSNAIKYGLGKPISIRVEKDEATQMGRIKVSDQGMGIPPELRQTIFERFERAEAAEKISGLGLGLYIARQIVRSHLGRIWVEGEPGQGSTFVVELPLGSPG